MRCTFMKLLTSSGSLTEPGGITAAGTARDLGALQFVGEAGAHTPYGSSSWPP
jgi:hypothetical protein